MKGYLAVVAVLGAVGAGGYMVATNPELPQRAQSAVAGAAAWTQHNLQAVPASAAVTTAPTPTATPTATPVPTPIALITPPPTPSATPDVGGGGGGPAGPALWSPADCAWAADTMATDAELDRAEYFQVLYDYDVRYGTGPTVIAYYHDYWAHWTAVLAEVRGWCADPAQAITDSQRSEAEGWFAAAIRAHMADTIVRPENQTWNDQWIASYQRLTALYAS